MKYLHKISANLGLYYPNETSRYHISLLLTSHILHILSILVIWVKCTSAWVEITSIMEYLPKIWAKWTGQVSGVKLPQCIAMIQAVFIKLHPTSEEHCYSPKFYPRSSKIYTDISAISVTFCKSDRNYTKAFTKCCLESWITDDVLSYPKSCSKVNQCYQKHSKS